MFRIAILILSFSASSFAAQSSEISGRFYLVGVITSSDKAGKPASVAVVKDKLTQRSLLLRNGEALPNESQWIVSKIERDTVTVKGQGLEISLLPYMDDKPEVVAAPEEPSATESASIEGLFKHEMPKERFDLRPRTDSRRENKEFESFQEEQDLESELDPRDIGVDIGRDDEIEEEDANLPTALSPLQEDSL